MIFDLTKLRFIFRLHCMFIDCADTCTASYRTEVMQDIPIPASEANTYLLDSASQ